MESFSEDLHQVDIPHPDHASIITHGDKTIVSIKKTVAPGVVHEFGFTFDLTEQVKSQKKISPIKKTLS